MRQEPQKEVMENEKVIVGPSASSSWASRAGAAGRLAAASAAGPAGMAIGATLIAVGSFAAGMALDPSGTLKGEITAQTLPLAAAGITAMIASVAALPAAAAGWMSARFNPGDGAEALKSAVTEAVLAARDQVAFGAAGVGFFAAASALAKVAEPSDSIAGLLACVPLAAAGVGASWVAASSAARSAFKSSAAAREYNGVPDEASAPGAVEVSLRLGGWREAKSAAGEPPSPSVQGSRLGARG